MVVKIALNDSNNPPGKRAEAEVHFTEGELAGLKLVGFAVWERRGGGGFSVTFPARQVRSTASGGAFLCCARSRTRRRRSAFEG